jgi:thiol-disulfide isomerase/thioredoxin
MKRFFYLVMAAAALVVACNGQNGKYSKLSGSFSSADTAPANVEVILGKMDTLIPVINGKFEAKIPVDTRTVAFIISDGQPLRFVSDGSRLKVDFLEKTVESSNKKGVNAQLGDFLAWQDDFMDDYQSKYASLPEEEQDAFMEKTLEEYNAHLKDVIKANPDNVLALICVSSLELDDDEEMLAILDGLSDELKKSTTVKAMYNEIKVQKATAEGKKFVDFTVVQDPDNPETSAVRLSNYVGKGKFVLVDFWASWCGPCREEMPFLKDVYKKYKGDNFDMLSIAVSDEPGDSKRAAEELGITWNQIVNAQHIPSDLYGIEYIPHIILFGPDGTILKRGIRGEEIGKAVAEALGQ